MPYSGAKATGAVGVPLEIRFTVIASTAPTEPQPIPEPQPEPEPEPEPEPQPQPVLAVTKFTLIDATGQSDLRELAANGTIDLTLDGKKLNIRADATDDVGSVVFYLDGKKLTVESTAPYAMGADDSGVYRAWTPGLGAHTLRAVPYSGAKATGTAGVPFEIRFTVIASPLQPAPQPIPEPKTQPEPEPVLAVTKFVLVDAATQRDIRELTNGDTIRLSEVGTALNIRAEVSGAAGSVKLLWNGSTMAVENDAPYAMAKDDDGVYRKWKPAIGTHTLRAIPYTRAKASGTAGQALQFSLKVVN